MLRRELLERYPDARLNDAGASLRGPGLAAFLAGCPKAITALEPVNEDLLAHLPDLRVISKVGVGIDMLDLDAMDRHGVQLAWATGTNSTSVAELVVAMVLSLLRHVHDTAADVARGEWRQAKGKLLGAKTVGIVGFGAVGREVHRILSGGFGCPVLVHDVQPLRDLPAEARDVALDVLLRESDVVTLHAALTASSRHMIGQAQLELMKVSAVLVNTARGGLIDESALVRALEGGSIAGAALDVLEIEPPETGPRATLRAMANVLITPHIGGSTEEAIVAMGRAAIAGLETSEPIQQIRRRLG